MRYLVNRTSKVIHDATRLRKACRAAKLEAEQNSETHVEPLLERGFRRCRFCNEEAG